MSNVALQSQPHKKSTTVRSLMPRLLQLAFRTASQVAPQATERTAAAMFFTPRGQPRGRRARTPEVAGLPRRSHVLPFGRERLRAWSWGAGKTVLLVHGWAGNAAQLRAFVSPLVAEGYRVVAFDMPAHGRSSGRQVTVIEMAQAIETVAEALGPLHAVIAHSLGGAATTLAIVRGTPVERVVLLAPAAEPRSFALKAAAMLGLSPEQQQGMLDRIEERLGESLVTFDVRLLSRTMTVPLLLMHDPEDREVPWAHGLGIAEAWRGARLERLTGLGHRRLLQDAQVIEHAVAFVDGGELGRAL